MATRKKIWSCSARTMGKNVTKGMQIFYNMTTHEKSWRDNIIFTLNSLLVQYCAVKRILWILSNARTCEDYDVMVIGGNGTAVYLANAIDLHCYLHWHRPYPVGGHVTENSIVGRELIFMKTRFRSLLLVVLDLEKSFFSLLCQLPLHCFTLALSFYFVSTLTVRKSRYINYCI